MSMVATPKTLAIGIDQALKLKSAVEAGNFSVITASSEAGTSITKKSTRSHAAFRHDLKRSVNGDGALRELLLDKAKVKSGLESFKCCCRFSTRSFRSNSSLRKPI